MVIAPHPDDELLGCGGYILKNIELGHEVFLVHVTELFEASNCSKSDVIKKKLQVEEVLSGLAIPKSHYSSLGFKPASLDSTSLGLLINKLSALFSSFKPSTILIPHFGDIHTDHQIVAQACISASKIFRSPFIKEILSYETLSETNFSLPSNINVFSPNLFVDITPYLDFKLALLKIYINEISAHPFPRSELAVKSLSILRGSQSAFVHAEAFSILKKIME